MLQLLSEAYAAADAVSAAAGVATKTSSSLQESPIAPEDMAVMVSPEKMMMDTLFFLLLLFLIFYFILIRPQQKRVKSHQEMVGAMQKGTKVVTGGGIIGTVVKFEGDDIVLIEIAPNVKVQVAKATIQEIYKPEGSTKIANDN